MVFQLDARIAAASLPLATLPLSDARLQNDARWPWIVLVPRSARLREIEDLSPEGRTRLIEEVLLAGRAVRVIGEAIGFAVEKLNVGALGNVVPQLHVHVLGRRAGDPAWPGPVWGSGEAEPYASDRLARAVAAALAALGG